jgi:hypothetical protein
MKKIFEDEYPDDLAMKIEKYIIKNWRSRYSKVLVELFDSNGEELKEEGDLKN